MHRWYLSYKVQGPVETPLSVHVLSVFSLEDHMHPTNFVPLDFFTFGGVKITETHQSHHFLFLFGFPDQIGRSHCWSFRNGIVIVTFPAYRSGSAPWTRHTSSFQGMTSPFPIPVSRPIPRPFPSVSFLVSIPFSVPFFVPSSAQSVRRFWPTATTHWNLSRKIVIFYTPKKMGKNRIFTWFFLFLKQHRPDGRHIKNVRIKRRF